MIILKDLLILCQCLYEVYFIFKVVPNVLQYGMKRIASDSLSSRDEVGTG